LRRLGTFYSSLSSHRSRFLSSFESSTILNLTPMRVDEWHPYTIPFGCAKK
jgi:hypothetical protein